ncbi:MAG: HAMP domain-containing protein [Candidatus Omnitrophica bacterium]|nr:HAMP domain-containing protein [Candidatus Omnitrophota bacterium]
MPLHSIRFKIVLWHMLILSLALLIFGMVLYHNFYLKIASDTDDILRSRAKGFEQSINTFWEAESMAIAQGNKRVHFTKEDNINFIRLARRWVEEKINDPELINTTIRIFDAHGNPIASTRNIPVEHLNMRIFNEVKKGADYYGNAYLVVDDKPVSFRMVTTPVMENKRLAYIVQVASPLSQFHNALRNLRFSLLFLLPLTIILTGLSGVFLVQMTLKPVDQMIETIHQITAENLKMRLKIPGTRDEIESLARTFNQMIARLDEAFTTQRQFMEDISHELKTPLSILKGELEVTLKKIRSAQEYEASLQSILEEVDSLVGIVGNLLTLARFDSKTTVLDARRLDLNLLVKDAVEVVQVLASQKGITLQYNGAHTVEAVVDKNQVRRMVLNILDNAIKYTPAGGKISVDLRRQGDTVDIDIADTGIGIPQRDLPHIFDRFYRVDKSRSSTGFGLGLSIAQSIAAAHGGRLTARANIPQGTVFTISLPVKSGGDKAEALLKHEGAKVIEF